MQGMYSCSTLELRAICAYCDQACGVQCPCNADAGCQCNGSASEKAKAPFPYRPKQQDHSKGQD
jgi:hypothetical protein